MSVVERMAKRKKAMIQAEAKTQEERDVQGQIVAEYATGLEMTEKVVGRLAGMKQLALEKKKKDKIRSLLKVFVGFVGLVFVCTVVSKRVSQKR